ncbi:hypothetical protein U3516DRAFT_96791 [Neocallimastix sp. 'constans']
MYLINESCIPIYSIYLSMNNISYFLIFVCMTLLSISWINLVKKIYDTNSSHFVPFIYKFINKYFTIFSYILMGAYGILYLFFPITSIFIIIFLQYLTKTGLILQCLMFYYYGFKIVSFLKKGYRLTLKSQTDENKNYIKKIKNIWKLTLYCIYSYVITFVVSFYQETFYIIGIPTSKFQWYFGTFLEILSFYLLIILIMKTLNVSKTN